MKNKAMLLFCAMLAFVFPARAESARLPEYPVVIVDSIFFTADSPCACAAKEGSASFLLRYAAGYGFSGCSADDYTVEQTPEGTRLTISGVNHAQRVSVTSARIRTDAEEPRLSVIVYEANGGQ